MYQYLRCTGGRCISDVLEVSVSVYISDVLEVGVSVYISDVLEVGVSVFIRFFTSLYAHVGRVCHVSERFIIVR